MLPTLAIHWIATTHGTWLHGDPRGSWHAGQLIGPDSSLESDTRDHMTHNGVVFSDDERKVVEHELRGTCTELKHEILALTIQATHVHLLLAPMVERIKTVVARLKRRASMEVLHQRRQTDDQAVPRTLWTAKRYIVFLNDEAHVKNTIAYIDRHP